MDVLSLIPQEGSKGKWLPNTRQKHSRTFKHLSFLLCLIRHWKYHCVGTKRDCWKPPGKRKIYIYIYFNALQASQSTESLIKLLAIIFRYAPRSCDAGTAAQQGLLGFSILICSANCLVLAKFKCFSQIPSSLSKAFFASWSTDTNGKLCASSALMTTQLTHFWLFYPQITPE